MTDKSNHRMLVKEGNSAKSMSSTKLWSKSKTSNPKHLIKSVVTERVLSRQSTVSVISIAACEQVTKYGGSWLCLMFKNWRKMSGYGSPRFRRVMIVTLSTQGSCVIVGIYTGLENHVVTDIMSQASLNAQIVKLFGEIVFILILERILNMQKRQPASSMQNPIPILVTDALTVRKGGGSLSEDSADSFEVHFDPNYSEYDLMANMQYKETKYSQELKLATSPVSNVFMPNRYHMECYKTLINYAQTHPKAN
jgi:hypothetical protein